MPESIQKKLSRVRAPRVHITYDVEVGDALETKEIPFVVGVLADLSGKPEVPLPKMKERKFVEIDRDNFNQVLEGMKPRVQYSVENKLTNDDSKIPIELTFKSMDDFHPERVVEKVEPLAKLLETRRRLSDLVSNLDGNDRLEELLQDVITSTDKQQKLGEEAGLSAEDESTKEEE